jgi:sugar phosphate isomerase/epimerase
MTIVSSKRPILGAALPLADLKTHRAWILEKQRDLELQDFFWADVLNSDWKPLVAAIKRELDGYTGRLGMHGPFWGFSIGTKDPDVGALVTKKLMQGLDVCNAVGATQMVIHSPYTTWDYYNLDNNSSARAEMIERVHAIIGPAVKRAEGIGCELVIENIEDKDAHARVELAKSFNSVAVRVSIDTGHANYAHGATAGPPVDYFVHAAGDMLHHVHLQDTDGYADRHWAPGDGNIAWTEVFRALAALKSNPRLILELRHRNEVRKGADHLIALGLAQ